MVLSALLNKQIKHFRIHSWNNQIFMTKNNIFIILSIKYNRTVEIIQRKINGFNIEHLRFM